MRTCTPVQVEEQRKSYKELMSVWGNNRSMREYILNKRRAIPSHVEKSQALFDEILADISPLSRTVDATAAVLPGHTRNWLSGPKFSATRDIRYELERGDQHLLSFLRSHLLERQDYIIFFTTVLFSKVELGAECYNILADEIAQAHLEDVSVGDLLEQLRVFSCNGINEYAEILSYREKRLLSLKEIFKRLDKIDGLNDNKITIKQEVAKKYLTRRDVKWRAIYSDIKFYRDILSMSAMTVNIQPNEKPTVYEQTVNKILILRANLCLSLFVSEQGESKNPLKSDFIKLYLDRLDAYYDHYTCWDRKKEDKRNEVPPHLAQANEIVDWFLKPDDDTKTQKIQIFIYYARYSVTSLVVLHRLYCIGNFFQILVAKPTYEKQKALFKALCLSRQAKLGKFGINDVVGQEQEQEQSSGVRLI